MTKLLVRLLATPLTVLLFSKLKTEVLLPHFAIVGHALINLHGQVRQGGPESWSQHRLLGEADATGKLS